MAKPHRADSPDPPIEEELPDPTDLARLSPEEIAFLLGGAPEPAEGQREHRLRAERNARSNAHRTTRRHTDAAFAEHLRAGERQRQQRKRAGASATPAAPPEPPVTLPALTLREAAHRLTDHIRDTDTPQTRQLRGRPDLVQRYVAGFTVYRSLSATGARPTRGALAEALRRHFGLGLTPAQVQNLRDQVEGFARPGGPWHTE
jgi:hypothetical protein